MRHIADLERQLEGTTAMISNYLEPDLTTWNQSIVPCELPKTFENYVMLHVVITMYF